MPDLVKTKYSNTSILQNTIVAYKESFIRTTLALYFGISEKEIEERHLKVLLPDIRFKEYEVDKHYSGKNPITTYHWIISIDGSDHIKATVKIYQNKITMKINSL